MISSEADIGLNLRPGQHNSLNMVHGGVVMTLLDVAMAHATGSSKYLTRGVGEGRRVGSVGGD